MWIDPKPRWECGVKNDWGTGKLHSFLGFNMILGLTTSLLMQEGILYEQQTSREVYELLDRLDPRIELRWIIPTGESVYVLVEYGRLTPHV
jgi:hypothetical protein